MFEYDLSQNQIQQIKEEHVKGATKIERRVYTKRGLFGVVVDFFGGIRIKTSCCLMNEYTCENYFRDEYTLHTKPPNNKSDRTFQIAFCPQAAVNTVMADLFI